MFLAIVLFLIGRWIYIYNSKRKLYIFIPAGIFIILTIFLVKIITNKNTDLSTKEIFNHRWTSKNTFTRFEPKTKNHITKVENDNNYSNSNLVRIDSTFEYVNLVNINNQ